MASMERGFRDRTAAGEALARELLPYASHRDVLALGLLRGGVPVAFAVAKALHAPLDIMLVRKLAVPGQQELALGAIASGGSRVLNEGLEIAALEGTYASVIGGAPAAAVVFAGEVEARTRKDERLQALTQAIAQADAASKARLRSEYDELFKLIQSEKLGEMAAEFDRVHSVHRALAVGALHHIIPPASLRPYLIQAVERGIARETKPAVGGNGKAATEQLQVAASTMVA